MSPKDTDLQKQTSTETSKKENKKESKKVKKEISEVNEFVLANDSKSKISLQEILDSEDKFFYLDRENNNEKDLQKLIKIIEQNSKSVKLNIVTFGLDEKDFIYELHVI